MEQIIFSKRIAAELRNKGFDIIRIEANIHKPEFNQYIFEATDEMIREYTNIVERNKNK